LTPLPAIVLQQVEHPIQPQAGAPRMNDQVATDAIVRRWFLRVSVSSLAGPLKKGNRADNSKLAANHPTQIEQLTREEHISS